MPADPIRPDLRTLIGKLRKLPRFWHPIANAVGSMLVVARVDVDSVADELEAALSAPVAEPPQEETIRSALAAIVESAGRAGWAHDAASSVVATRLIENARAALQPASALPQRERKCSRCGARPDPFCFDATETGLCPEFPASALEDRECICTAAELAMLGTPDPLCRAKAHKKALADPPKPQPQSLEGK